MVMQKIIPAGATISELKKKAAESEEKAKQASEPEGGEVEGRSAAIPGVDRAAAFWQMVMSDAIYRQLPQPQS